MAVYVAEWLATYKSGLRSTTYATYKHDSDLIISHIGPKQLKAVTLSDVQNILNTRKGLSASAIKKTNMTLKAIFEAARLDRHIIFNPCDKLSVPSGTVGTHKAIDKGMRIFLTQSATDHRMYLPVMLMLFAGLRRGEALVFNIDRDVDWENQTLSVREAVHFANGKAIVSSPKTAAGTRTIPILPPLDTILPKYKGTGNAFKDAHGHTIQSETAFRRTWASYLYCLEVLTNGVRKRWASEEQLSTWQTIDLQCHDLRHTFCTMLYDGGIDIKTAQLWMGHSDPMVTMRIYTHLTKTKNSTSMEAAKKHFLSQL